MVPNRTTHHKCLSLIDLYVRQNRSWDFGLLFERLLWCVWFDMTWTSSHCFLQVFHLQLYIYTISLTQIKHIKTNSRKEDQSRTSDPLSTLNLKITHSYVITKKTILFLFYCPKNAVETKALSIQPDTFTKTGFWKKRL